MYEEGAKLWNSMTISNGIKTTENISEFITLMKKWNGTLCTCKNYITIPSLNKVLYLVGLSCIL